MALAPSSDVRGRVAAALIAAEQAEIFADRVDLLIAHLAAGGVEVTERRYTLAQAERVIAERECLERGHDYLLTVAQEHDPSLLCSRCGRTAVSSA